MFECSWSFCLVCFLSASCLCPFLSLSIILTQFYFLVRLTSPLIAGEKKNHTLILSSAFTDWGMPTNMKLLWLIIFLILWPIKSNKPYINIIILYHPIYRPPHLFFLILFFVWCFEFPFLSQTDNFSSPPKPQLRKL